VAPKIVCAVFDLAFGDLLRARDKHEVDTLDAAGGDDDVGGDCSSPSSQRFSSMEESKQSLVRNGGGGGDFCSTSAAGGCPVARFAFFPLRPRFFANFGVAFLGERFSSMISRPPPPSSSSRSIGLITQFSPPTVFCFLLLYFLFVFTAGEVRSSSFGRLRTWKPLGASFPSVTAGSDVALISVTLFAGVVFLGAFGFRGLRSKLFDGRRLGKPGEETFASVRLNEVGKAGTVFA